MSLLRSMRRNLDEILHPRNSLAAPRSVASLLLDPVRRARIQRRLPFLRDCDERIRELRAAIEPHHTMYTTSVSKPGMAVSLQTSVLLQLLCERLSVRRVLDLGSGFSSWVLRTWARTRDGVEITSVDDNPEWLEKTREFLRKQGLSDERLLLWQDFRPVGDYDLIFHDLGRMPMRMQSLGRVLELGESGGGVVVLDDVHKRKYADVVAGELAKYECAYVDLSPFTYDHLGRFSSIVTKLRSRSRTI